MMSPWKYSLTPSADIGSGGCLWELSECLWCSGNLGVLVTLWEPGSYLYVPGHWRIFPDVLSRHKNVYRASRALLRKHWFKYCVITGICPRNAYHWGLNYESGKIEINIIWVSKWYYNLIKNLARNYSILNVLTVQNLLCYIYIRHMNCIQHT